MKCYHLKYYRKVTIKGNVMKKDRRGRDVEFMETVVAEDLEQALAYWDRYITDPDNRFIGLWAGEPVATVLREEGR